MKHKLLGWVLLAFALFFVVKSPAGAAHAAHHLGTGLGQLAAGLAAFVNALTSS
jgi:hypothetical protein